MPNAQPYRNGNCLVIKGATLCVKLIISGVDAFALRFRENIAQQPLSGTRQTSTNKVTLTMPPYCAAAAKMAVVAAYES